MATILPFKAIRYNLKTKKSSEKNSDFVLGNLICPPYDIINNEKKRELINLSRYNFVNIELPDNPANAKKIFNTWYKNNILIEDIEPSIYVYQQEFISNDKKITRTGFFCIMKLDKKQFIKHEEVSEKPVENRLNLLKAIRCNTSPIFCLFDDTQNKVSKILDKVVSKKPDLLFTDRDNIKHKLWILKDNKLITEIQLSLSKKPVFIADGHHRYTVSSIYRDEMMKKDSDYDESKDYNYILTFLCSLTDPGLVILPTHRVVHNCIRLQELLKRYFYIKSWDGKAVPFIVLYNNGEFNCIIPKKKTEDIHVINLHKLLLDKIYRKDEILYTKDIKEAVEHANRINGVAFLINTIDIKQIYKLSKKNKIMPHKTTYFYPKIPAGIVTYKLTN